MKIVRVRTSGWAIQSSNGEWLDTYGGWTRDQGAAYTFRRLADAEVWFRHFSVALDNLRD
jgi:hypothetical protein